ncbi:MAG: sigma factor [Gemmatimonadaceae bacterium]
MTEPGIDDVAADDIEKPAAVRSRSSGNTILLRPVSRANVAVSDDFNPSLARSVPYSSLLVPMDASISPTDDELMIRAQGGDGLAFEQIYGRYEARVYAFLWRITANTALASDLRQDAFFTLWQNRHNWKDGGSVSAYLVVLGSIVTTPTS